MYPTGIEPVTSRLSTACCCQLSYGYKLGCKDSNPDQQLQRLRSCRLDDIPIERASDRIRTGDLLFHRQALSAIGAPLAINQNTPAETRTCDHALMRRSQDISLPLFRLSYGSKLQRTSMGPVRLELTIHGLKGRCLLQFGHGPEAGRAGFEPALSSLKDWRLDRLPNAPQPLWILGAGPGNAPGLPGL